MAAQSSFDISTGADLQEVDNAVNQAHKEIRQRYDFKGSNCTLEFLRKEGALQLEADDEYRLQALLQVLREKLIRRGVSVKNLDEGPIETGSLGRARQRLGLKQGIDEDTARRMNKDIRSQGFNKVQVQVQGEELRVSSPSRDSLQEVIQFLKGQDYDLELKFGNYR